MIFPLINTTRVDENESMRYTLKKEINRILLTSFYESYHLLSSCALFLSAKSNNNKVTTHTHTQQKQCFTLDEIRSEIVFPVYPI